MQVPDIKMERAKSFVVKPTQSKPTGSSSNDLNVPSIADFRRCNSFNNSIVSSDNRRTLQIEDRGNRSPSGGKSPSGLRSPSHYARRGAFTSKPKFKMKEKTKVMLKLHVIKEKCESVNDLLMELRQMTFECQDLDLVRNHEMQEEFVNKVLDVDANVKMARKLLLFLCKHRPLQRHFRYHIIRLSSIE